MSLPKELGARIGILGGTFDPVHRGHIVAASTAMERLKLDSVLFIPAAHPPHKNNYTVTDFHDRVAMLTSAVSNLHGFFVSDIEAERNAPSFTVDTLRILRQRLDRDVSLYFIVGLDAFMELETWKEYGGILDSANLVVLNRPSDDIARFDQKTHELFGDFFKAQHENVWHREGASESIYYVKMRPVPISSTGIRATVKGGGDFQQYIPESVFQYITEKKLYI